MIEVMRILIYLNYQWCTVYSTYHIRNCVHIAKDTKGDYLKKADIINARRKKEKEMYGKMYCKTEQSRKRWS